MLKDFSPQAAFMGVLVAFVGFASSFAVVLQGLKGVGATDYEAASGLMALSVAMGICGIVLSVWTKLPVSVAWSTPGAALMATAGIPVGGFPAAVGAFLVCAALIVLAMAAMVFVEGAPQYLVLGATLLGISTGAASGITPIATVDWAGIAGTPTPLS